MKQSSVVRIAAALVAVVTVFASVPDAALAQGESAVPFLLIAPNSRASGIGETGTGSVDDVSAVYWNPGALAFLNGSA